jgi:hypothetical protein
MEAMTLRASDERWTMRRSMLAVAMTGVLSLVAAPAAWAGTVSFDDEVGDTGSRSDITRVVVEHVHTADRLRVTTRLTKVVYGAELAIFIDSRPRNAGPEWKISAYADSEWALLRVDSWRDDGMPGPTCGRVSYSMDADPPVARATFPSSCIRLHRDVRVSVLVHDAGHGRDWAPDTRRFLPAA